MQLDQKILKLKKRGKTIDIEALHKNENLLGFDDFQISF